MTIGLQGTFIKRIFKSFTRIFQSRWGNKPKKKINEKFTSFPKIITTMFLNFFVSILKQKDFDS